MGEYSNNGDITDDQRDAIILAGAFQAASDEDTRMVMNAMSTSSKSTDPPLHFYIVPASWFLNAFPVLTARTAKGISNHWRDNIGRIANAELLNLVEHEVSSDEDVAATSTNTASNIAGGVGDVSEIQRKRFELMHRRMARNREQATMKPGLLHKKDYFFLGPNAWMLVKEKFGFDGYELPRPCVSSTESSHSTMSIQLRPEEIEGVASNAINIPATGRFPYELVVANAQSTKPAAIVPQDEDTNVEDEVKSTEDSPVLLLPPSTTAASYNPSADDDDMDVETTSGTGVQSGRKRLASGLGNLGNTCFMNCSIQCLAHTAPLRRYFLSGEYAKDLNKDNPLGTGGELATQFADLIGDMWGVPSKRRNVLGPSDSNYSTSNSQAIYPRSFKYCLGKHAEQFVGYEQHDSQELATYLLDALHEDTNRITKKPYIEKPEQEENEPDDVAAAKAWSLHLQREDSRVLENFMGQVKSRLQCCREDCNRVSTTFDPFMYLSVPIPGATDRTLKITFVPLDPAIRMKSLSLTLNKASTIKTLLTKMNLELVAKGVIKESVPLEDLCAADVWSHEIFSVYNFNSDIDAIRDTDTTFIYQLQSLAEVQEQSKPKEEPSVEALPPQRPRKYKLDPATTFRLGNSNNWETELEQYVRSPTMLASVLNPRRGTIDDRVQLVKKLEHFIDICHLAIAKEEAESESTLASSSEEVQTSTSMEDTVQSLVDHSDSSPSFKGVQSRQDVAVLEFCATKLRLFTLRMAKDKGSECKDGLQIQVLMRRPRAGGDYSTFVQPFVVRIPSRLTVYGFRELLAKRLSRSLQTGRPSEAAREGVNGCEKSTASEDGMFGSPELMIIRQVEMAYNQKATGSGKASPGGTLGMVSRKGLDGNPPATLAMPSNEAEKEVISELVGAKGTIFVDWPQELCERVFDNEEFDAEDCIDDAATIAARMQPKKTTTVLDCIKKYCQMEQLEETEMWYCNRCKDHVRAWKQFHIYQSPPILIVHLKRFHYSSRTHRRDKITSFIDFPLEGLDLTEVVSHYDEGKEPIYDCYAVSNHYGGLGGGHYTAYAQIDDGTWCHYDDTRVTSNVPTSEVVSEAAYVLYYRRRDVPVGQDIIQDSQSNMIFDQVEQNSGTNVVYNSDIDKDADEDDDNMAVDGDGSSRTCSSPMGSIDSQNDQAKHVISFVNDEDFPPLQ